MSLVFRDAFWQIGGRVISALVGFLVVKLLTPYLGPLRYGDYSTIFKYFAIWSALADFGIYVIALNVLGKIKDTNEKLKQYHKFLGFRFFMVFVVYLTAFCVAWFIPSYASNPYIAYGLVFGMVFSALFMLAGIVQIPLQLNWKMKDVTIALILARLVQILVLVAVIYLIFPDVNFSNFSLIALFAFLAILLSVVLSGLTQFLYVLWKGNKLMKFRLDFDFTFIKNNLKENWRYGVSYFLSSFHTLIVLIFLSIFFPTSKGFDYVGIWALALGLIEILLIVPAAFGNSIIHKISSYEKVEKLKALGFFAVFIIWFGSVVLLNYSLFSYWIIKAIAGAKYLSSSGTIGSDFLLPFLSVVLFLSFVKQIFNYIMVSFKKQNYLFYVNLVGVGLGLLVAIHFIPRYHLIGGLITQLFLEVCFVVGAIIIALKFKIFPKLDLKLLFKNLIFFLVLGVVFYFIVHFYVFNYLTFLLAAILLNTIILAFSYKFIKKIMAQI